MPNVLVLNCAPHEVRVGLLEDDRVAEIFVERRKDASLVGNIYKGRVLRVLPGMQAAFVDIGLERAAFLYVADVVDPRRDSSSNTVSEARTDMAHRPIQSLLHEGQELMVQVSKEPLGTKGARVTSHVSIAGRHLVYMPTVDHVGVSRRIVDDEERKRLREILEALVPQGGGFVARTAAEGRSPEELRADLEFLRQVWNDILTRTESSTAPATLYEDLDLVLRSARDLVTPELEAIHVDDEVEFQRLTRFMRRFMPRYMDRVKHYPGPEPIFDAYGVEIELQRALGRKVWLKSGGYLIIDQTEALCAVDVNTGRFVGKRNLEETITRTNLEAVQEIVRQLRLRNIGGIIIIDFIDMEKESNRNKVFGALSDALQADRARTNILKISELGLVEMTRKRVRESLARSLSEPCFYCDGSGLLKSRTTVAYEIYRTLLREAFVLDEPVLRIGAHPRVAQLLLEDERSMLAELEARVDKRIEVEARPDFHLEHYEFATRPAAASNGQVGADMDRRSGDRQTINQEFANLEQFRSEFASDISTTGCFIRSPRPLPVGTKVALKFTVIEGDLAIIEGTGEVVRSVRPPHANPGMGVRFVELTPTSAGALEQMLAPIPADALLVDAPDGDDADGDDDDADDDDD